MINSYLFCFGCCYSCCFFRYSSFWGT